jgi:hypothetical protein
MREAGPVYRAQRAEWGDAHPRGRARDSDRGQVDGSRCMADPRGGSGPDFVVAADPTGTLDTDGHGDGGGAQARCTADRAAVGKYGDHFPDDTFIPLAVETYEESHVS